MKSRTKISALLVTLILVATLVTTAYAATQSIGGTATLGNLRVSVEDNGAMSVEQYDGSVWQQNIFGVDAKGSTLCVGTTRYDMGGNSTWTPGLGGTAATWVSNSGGVVGTGSIVTTWTAGGMTIVQTTSYTDGNQYYTIAWDVTNNSGGTINDLRLFHGQDTLLAGSDSGTGWWNAGLGTFGSIGVTHPSNGQQMWLQTVSEAPFNYESRYYFTTRSNVDNCALDGTVDAATHDNGYALEFRHATLANSATWNVTIEEHFVPAEPPIPAPTITSVFPNSGSTAGGTTVTITGTDLTNGTFTFGGSTADCIVAPDGLSATCTTPPHSAGCFDVVVTTPGGTDTAAGAFCFIPPPTITDIQPYYGPITGGTMIVITGTNLTDGTFTIDGITMMCEVAPDGLSAVCTTPAHVEGWVDVTVTTIGGSDTWYSGFYYYTPITMMFESQGRYDGHATESMAGSGLGKSASASGGYIQIGDTYKNWQVKGFLSFDTSTLPDSVVEGNTVVVTDATVILPYVLEPLHGNPFETHGPLYMDIVAPYFGSSLKLVPSDFQATPSAFIVGICGRDEMVAKQYLCPQFNSYEYINTLGTTQYRLSFALPTDFDRVADYFRFASGNHPNKLYRPELSVTYFILPPRIFN